MEGTNRGVENNAATPAARATYQDVLDTPEHIVSEIIGGTGPASRTHVDYMCSSTYHVLWCVKFYVELSCDYPFNQRLRLRLLHIKS